MSLAYNLASLHDQFDKAVTKIDCFLLVADKGIGVDKNDVAEHAKKLLSHPDSDSEPIRSMIKELEWYTYNVSVRYFDVALRMSFVYLIAQFDAFLSDILEAVMVANPDTLKSSKQLSYKEILEHLTMEELKSFLAKRAVHDLGYKSIKDQAKHYEIQFKIVLSDSGVSLDTLTEINAARNLLVHNNGVVNQIYLEAVSNSTYKLGDKISMSFEYWMNTCDGLRKVADHVTQKLIEKFGG